MRVFWKGANPDRAAWGEPPWRSYTLSYPTPPKASAVVSLEKHTSAFGYSGRESRLFARAARAEEHAECVRLGLVRRRAHARSAPVAGRGLGESRFVARAVSRARARAVVAGERPLLVDVDRPRTGREAERGRHGRAGPEEKEGRELVLVQPILDHLPGGKGKAGWVRGEGT